MVLLLSGFQYCQKQANGGTENRSLDGEYVAFEKMPSISPDDPEVKWFHENTLLVKNNEAVLDMVPVSIRRGEKSYSASDGGFLTYRGRFFQKEGQTFVELRLFKSDYIPIPVDRDHYKEIKTRSVKLTGGKIEIDGVQYKRKTLREARRNELLQVLNDEPTPE